MKKMNLDPAKSRTKSSWTPLTDAQMNLKMFEERRNLVLIWFSKWTELQRKQIFLDLLPLCSENQLEYAENILRDKVPKHHVDFTRCLPRVLSLYIFSFLDPRSLCRCSQVCWYWKYLTESNELWATKCLRRGWTLTDSRLSKEQGIWKKHYIQNMRFLRFAGPMKATAVELMKQLENAHKEAELQAQKARERRREEIRQEKQQLQKSKVEQQKGVIKQSNTPWRAPTKNPAETHRLNYFDNRSPRHETKIMPIRKYRLNPSTEPDLPRLGEPSDLAYDVFRGRDGSCTMPERKRCVTPNPMITGPKVPWRPTSKRPERQSATDVYETRRRFSEVRGFLRRQYASAEPSRTRHTIRSPGRDEDVQSPAGYLTAPARAMSAQINTCRLQSLVKMLSESETALEDLPPPPMYVELDEGVLGPNTEAMKPGCCDGSSAVIGQVSPPRLSPREKPVEQNRQVSIRKHRHYKWFNESLTPDFQWPKTPTKMDEQEQEQHGKVECHNALSGESLQEPSQHAMLWHNCESMELSTANQIEDRVPGTGVRNGILEWGTQPNHVSDSTEILDTRGDHAMMDTSGQTSNEDRKTEPDEVNHNALEGDPMTNVPQSNDNHY